ARQATGLLPRRRQQRDGPLRKLPKYRPPMRIAASRPASHRLVGSLRGDEFPVGIARHHFPREGPDIRDFLDPLGVAADHLAPPVAGGRDQLAHELDGYLSHTALELRFDDVGGLYANEALVYLFATTFPLGDGSGKPVIDLTAQEVAQRLAIALGERR